VKTRSIVTAVALTAAFASSACSKKDGTEAGASTEGAASAEGTATPQPGSPIDAAPAKATETTRFQGEGFSIPIPEHYTAVTDEVRANLSKQLGQAIDGVLVKDRRDGGFTPSIVVTRVAASDVDPSDVKTCETAAAEMTKVVGATSKAPATSKTYPFGKTCQFEIGDAQQHAIQTIVYVDKDFWTLTCNSSPQAIELGRSECEQVLAGFGR